MEAGFLNAAFADLKTQLLHKNRKNYTEGETQAACKTDDNGARPLRMLPNPSIILTPSHTTPPFHSLRTFRQT